MKSIKRIIRMMSLGAIVIAGASCSQAEKKTEEAGFRYLIDEFADLKVMRYRIPGWEELSLRQKEYVYHLAEAAKWGRDIYFEQNCEGNLRLRKVIEKIINEYAGDRTTADYLSFEVYAKRVFFSNGVHHHYAEDKFFPECSKEYFASLMESVGAFDQGILDFVYDRETGQQRRSTSQEGDIVTLSAVNYYEGVTRKEVEDYYASIEDKNDPRPIAYGLNTKVVKQDGKVTELPWCVGGLYSDLITKICDELEKAAAVAENDTQRKCISLLVDYYRTGDLRKWDEYNVAWVGELEGTVDFVNGFVEDYNDPLGRKGAWEGNVNIKDHKASERTEILSANAQWFEDNSPVDPRFRKPEVKGVSAKVITGAIIAGDLYPATAIGINLPNSNWIRSVHGSKSVTIGNFTDAYNKAAHGNGFSDEFVYSEVEKAYLEKYGDLTNDLHTDLHECLGHGSGQLLPGVDPDALRAYGSTIEEARADLFGLYYLPDAKMRELGLTPHDDAYKAEYYSYMMNGLMTQLVRIEPGNNVEEAHMRNRQLIAKWAFEKGAADKVVELVKKDGKTYVKVNDYEKLRELFGQLLKEIQRIKSEGDFESARQMVETYAVKVDADLHQEILERYAKLNLAPYKGFVNPVYTAQTDAEGNIVDVTISYEEGYAEQMLRYSKDYATLPYRN